MNLLWQIKDWKDLSRDELYEIIALRIAVFVVEQNCPYQDADGKDYFSKHLFATDVNGKCRAYLRLVRPGISYEEWSIGRVATDIEIRNTGTGKILMSKGISQLHAMGVSDIRISAQSYLKKFYMDLGFVQVSDEYLEDDIPHIEMLLSQKNNHDESRTA